MAYPLKEHSKPELFSCHHPRIRLTNREWNQLNDIAREANKPRREVISDIIRDFLSNNEQSNP